MKNILTILAVLLPMSLMAQMFDPVRTNAHLTTISDTEVEVTVDATIDAGWHVYSSKCGDAGPIIAEFTIEKLEGATKKGGIIERGTANKHFDDMFGAEVVSYEKKAVFAQRFTLTGGKYSISGYLTLGACNNQNCMPPMTTDFSFDGESKVVAPVVAETSTAAPVAEVKESVTETVAEVQSEAETVAENAVTETSESKILGNGDLWTPVIDEIKAFGEGEAAAASNASLWAIFIMGFAGGFLALLTPCVWPIIPMTVSFFLKRNKNSKSKAISEAMAYGASIVVIYVLLGTLVSALWGASALNALSTNAVFNIIFCLLLVVFAASFMGAFELTLPSSWSDKMDAKVETTTGMLSIFFMAFTLALVSFSCTGPIIGFLLVQVADTGSILAPVIGMLGFAIALALPFTLFALFPSMLKSVPKSGGWMNRIKVTLGFIELAFALKFLSVADMAYGWHILDREVFLVLWILLFALLGLYHLGIFKFEHDDEEEQGIGVTRFFVALFSLAFALYMVPGLWGAPLKAISAFTPSMNTQDFKLGENEVRAKYFDYEEGMAAARREGKPVLLDFTGYGCVNCRKMEAAVWTNSEVSDILLNDYVLITLYVDDKTPLPEPIEMGGRTLRTVGDKWSYLQASKFGANTQPFYVPVTTDGHPKAAPYSYNENVDAYIKFLKSGL